MVRLVSLFSPFYLFSFIFYLNLRKSYFSSPFSVIYRFFTRIYEKFISFSVKSDIIHFF